MIFSLYISIDDFRYYLFKGEYESEGECFWGTYSKHERKRISRIEIPNCTLYAK